MIRSSFRLPSDPGTLHTVPQCSKKRAKTDATYGSDRPRLRTTTAAGKKNWHPAVRT